MEEGCSSVYAVSDELDESSLSSELELEVEQPSQCTPGGPAGPIVTLLERLKAPAASDLARKRTYFLLICRIIAQFSGIIGEFDGTIDLLFVNKKIECLSLGPAKVSSSPFL